MKPYVFNADYYLAQDMGRLPYGVRARKPWWVDISGVVKKFRTHAKAISYADKMARKVKEQP